MAQTASQRKRGVEGKMLYVALELGWTSWRLGFCTRLDEKAWVATIGARDVAAMKKTIAKARARFGVSAACPVASCYEAGRDGFWLDRLLKEMGVSNVVVDSGSIKVDRRARRGQAGRPENEEPLEKLGRKERGRAEVRQHV